MQDLASRTFLAALALLLLLPLGARADGLTIGIGQYPSTLHPNIESMAAKAYVHGLSHRPITQYDPNWKLRCYLCVELPTIENGGAVPVPHDDGGKGVDLTYTLKPDAVWGDGTPITTEDVRFTWEVGRHPQSGVGNAELYRRIEDITLKDAKTFTLHSSVLDFTYNAINDFRLLPAHLEREVFEADPATYRNRTLYVTAPETPGLWQGPYLVTAAIVGSHVALARNPLWWGEAPAFDTITVRAIENTNALENALLAGEVDMIEGSLGLTLDQALAFERRHSDRFTVAYKPGLIYEHLDVMLDDPILEDRRVRQALLYAIDRETLNQQLFGGRQPVAHSSVSPLDVAFAKRLPAYAHDPERAADLLEEAGWSPGPDGVRRNAQGERLAFTLMTTAGNRSRELVQQWLQSEWRKLGVEARIQNEPPRVFFAETTSKRRFDGLAMFAWISSPENVPRSTLHSEEIPTEANGWSGQNYPGYENPKMDRLIDALEIELDPEARLDLWADLQRLYAEDLPALPLYFRADAHVWPKWLRGVEPSGHLAPTTLGVERWRRVED